MRTVVKDAWAIIQHHLVYKRESEVPTHIQRKLNSLAGLFETVDDEFESIRREREIYIAEVRESRAEPNLFLENELNLDSFKEYLSAKFPGVPIEGYDGQARVALDGLVKDGWTTLRDLDTLLKKTAAAREELKKQIKEFSPQWECPSNAEAAFALAVSSENWKELIPWNSGGAELIAKFRSDQTWTSKPGA